MSAAFIPVSAIVLRHAFQQVSATSGLEFDVVAATHSASVVDVVFE